MNLIIAGSYDEMSRLAADVLSQQVQAKPDSVLGLATGTTPIGLYKDLVADYEAGKVSFKAVKTFNLDEYVGLEGTHPQSYRWFMRHYLFDHIDIDLAATHTPDVANPDEAAASDAYESAIEAAGGVDVQLLGIGCNGHIGFNEPREDFPKVTHTVTLTQNTREANSRLFDSIDEVPTQARTMGIGTIMKARKILLVANGPSKAKIMKEALYGPVTPQVPASILQFHPNVTVICDAEAGALLK